MADVVFKLNSAGLRDLLQSKEMLAMTKSYALKMGASSKNIRSFIGFDRAKTIVYPTNRKGAK